jgi:hypothetical protein
MAATKSIFDFRTVCPPGTTPPGLNCDACRSKVPYGESVVYSDASNDTDYCASCYYSLPDKEDLVKTTCMERCAPMAERIYGRLLLEKTGVVEGPPPVRRTYAARPLAGSAGVGVLEVFEGAPPDFLAHFMREHPEIQGLALTEE